MCGHKASWSTMRSIRPERDQKVVAAVLVVMDAQGRGLCHDGQRRAMCPRIGEAWTTGAVCHLLDGTWLRKRGHAHRVRGALEGVSPFFFAFFCAMLRRALTMASGIRPATRRAGTRACAPRKMAHAMRGPATVWRLWVHATCGLPLARGTKRVAC